VEIVACRQDALSGQSVSLLKVQLDSLQSGRANRAKLHRICRDPPGVPVSGGKGKMEKSKGSASRIDLQIDPVVFWLVFRLKCDTFDYQNYDA